MLTVQYPGSTGASGPSLAYAYDSMGRLNTMTDQVAQQSLISGTTYDPASRLSTITGSVYNEQRTYNVLGQLTWLSNSSVNITYNYSSTQNNGKITGQSDNVSGEQVVYINSTTAGPFGCSIASTSYAYDVSNRIVSVPGYTAYAYAPGNKRVWRGTSSYTSGLLTLDELTFWSVNGQKLATYTIQGGHPRVVYNSPSLTVVLATSNYYFGRKVIKNANGYVGADRLGSVGKYYPWGQEKPSATANGTEKFTGYFRDAETGLDYAKNRYHQPGMGRFLTPDPFMARRRHHRAKNYSHLDIRKFVTPFGRSSGPNIPGSWNLYSYVGGDPINFNDPTGRISCWAGDDDDDDCIDDPGGGGGGGGGDDDDDDDDDDDNDQLNAQCYQQVTQAGQTLLSGIQSSVSNFFGSPAKQMGKGALISGIWTAIRGWSGALAADGIAAGPEGAAFGAFVGAVVGAAGTAIRNAALQPLVMAAITALSEAIISNVSAPYYAWCDKTYPVSRPLNP